MFLSLQKLLQTIVMLMCSYFFRGVLQDTFFFHSWMGSPDSILPTKIPKWVNEWIDGFDMISRSGNGHISPMKTNMSLENSRWKKTFLLKYQLFTRLSFGVMFFASQRFFPTLENLSSGHREKNRCLLKKRMKGFPQKNIKSCRRECRFPKRSIFFGQVWDHPNVVFAYTHDGWMFFHYEISMMSW